MRYRLQQVRLWFDGLRTLAATTTGTIFLFFSCLYILTYQGRSNSYDGQSMFATTRSLVEHGTLAISSVSASAFGTIGRGGLYYSKYGVGQSLAELPLYLMGKMLGLFAGAKSAQVAESVAMLTNPLIMAATCAVFYGIVRQLGYVRTTAIWATLALGIATSFWPYSKTDFSEPLLALSLAVAVLCALRAARLLAGQRATGDTRTQQDLLRLDLITGIALGIGVVTKYAAVIYLPVFLVYFLLPLPGVALRDLPHELWATRRVLVQRLSALLIPVVLAGLLVLLVDALRFGSPWMTGYAPSDRPFSGSVPVGLSGLLISPFAGLLFYDPLLFAGLLALPLLLWRHPREALLPLGLFCGSLLFYSGYHAWTGGSAWGPRYLVPALPYLLLPLLPLGCFGPAKRASSKAIVAQDERNDRHRWPHWLVRGATIGLVSISVLVQFLGVSVNYLMEDTYWLLSLHRFGNLTSSLRASPLALSCWVLRLSWQYAFLRTFAHGYASAQYPFGPPYPIAPHMPQSGGVFPLQFFWFTLTPLPLLALGIGIVVLGSGMLLAAWKLSET